MASGKFSLLRKIDPFERQDDAEHAIEGAGVGNGVDVRAEDQAFAGAPAGCQRPRRLPTASTCTVMPRLPCARADAHEHGEPAG